MITIKRKKLLVLISLLVILALAANECGGGQEAATTDFVDSQQAWYNKYQSVHFYTFSLEKAVVQQIYDARNEARSTHAYSFSMVGSIIFDCPSRGFPIPYGVQLTNPVRKYGYSGYDAVIAQAEPNGLYSTGITTESTWYLCNRTIKSADGTVIGSEVAPVYSEPQVMSFPFPVVEQNGRLYDIQDAPSSIQLDLSRPADIPTTGPSDLGPGAIVK